MLALAEPIDNAQSELTCRWNHYSYPEGTVDELINKVTEKAGINVEQAKTAVNTVIEFIKAKVPGLGDQITGLLSGAGGSAGDVLDSVKKKFGF